MRESGSEDVTNRELRREAAKKKARELRWKKPLVHELNLDDIRMNLSEMEEACSNVRWYLGKEVEELEELLGEDDAFEFQNSFSALSGDIYQVQNQLDEIWIPEYFDDFLAAVHPEGKDVYGYDEYEEDSFRLDGYMAEFACQEAGERMQRKTKKELIDCCHTVLGVVCLYMSIKYRFDSLSAAFDVLMERSEKQLRAVREIEEAYEAAEKEGFDEWNEATRKLDKLIRELPDRIWIE